MNFKSSDVKERRSASCQQKRERKKKKQVKVCHFLSICTTVENFTAHLIRLFIFIHFRLMIGVNNDLCSSMYLSFLV